MLPVRFVLVVPLQSHAGNVWHVVRGLAELPLPDNTLTDDEIEIEVDLDVNGRTVRVAPRIRCEAMLEPVVVLDPIVVDPAPGAPGLVDADGRVDGMVVEEVAG